ncbi:MAG TPA: hypothetical protein VNJ50_02205 [Gelidibacter sp.]|uniref:hypothetical protein n=1 Tax=Gelidibacter sp. TaxID=2018083 RepID=UPI002BE20CB2|nr:hypothetical protein [Gelidibacter sp.]HXJ97635.1 hypothetical protein [Gelidibacter sp.]
MKKAILISVRPEHLVNILNGNKTLELRKSIPKEYEGRVNLYCTINYDLNGKVVARFWFDETYYIKQAVNVYGDELNQISIYDNKSYGWKTPKEQQEILKQLCLTEQEVLDYVKGKGANAWNIKQLEIFDKPKELGEFYKLSVDKVESAYIQLDKAPQSWQFVYTKELENESNKKRKTV